MALNILILVLEKYAAPIFRVHLWISVNTFHIVCLFKLTTSFPFILNLTMESACSLYTLVSTTLTHVTTQKL
jgi:hypothetical protein